VCWVWLIFFGICGFGVFSFGGGGVVLLGFGGCCFCWVLCLCGGWGGGLVGVRGFFVGGVVGIGVGFNQVWVGRGGGF